MTRFGLLVGAMALLGAAPALAQYPPPQSPEDQHCRQVAQSRIFSEPNPEGLSLTDHGYRIWSRCMRQAGASVPGKRRASVRG